MPRSRSLRSSRYSTTRQKSCQSCSTSRSKCDRKETCGRCALRGLVCTYPLTAVRSRDTSMLSEDTANPFVLDLEALQTPNSTNQQTDHSLQSMIESTHGFVCPINSDDIRNRWLNTFIPLQGQVVKRYPPNVIKFVDRMLKSYASMVLRGRAPPFVHHTQLSSPPLSTCFTLVRLCKDPLTGSEKVVTEILQREMTRLHEGYTLYSHVDLLGVFQAYLIYSMVLFFNLDQASMSFLRQAIIDLQEIACATSRQGLVCIAEQEGLRPEWEMWTVAEAKRRTLYTMYFLDNVLSAKDGLPTYIAHELKGLYAPSSKELWQGDQAEWEKGYDSHMDGWRDEMFQLDELWSAYGMEEGSVERIRRQERTDRWLEGVDEFGTMLYAVTSCIHGGE